MALGRERVRRASLCLRLLRELSPDLVEGFGEERPSDLGTPAPEGELAAWRRCRGAELHYTPR